MSEPKPARQQRGRPPLSALERKRILDATTDVFLEHGYERASTSEIARRARTSKQTLYALYPTKADMFVAAVSAQTESLYARHSEYIASTEPPATVLLQMGLDLLQMFLAPRFLPLYRAVVGETHHFPDLARQLWRTTAERGYGLMTDYLTQRRIGGPDYRKSAVQFVSLVLGDAALRVVLNPDAELNDMDLETKARDAASDFLRLHPVRPTGK